MHMLSLAILRATALIVYHAEVHGNWRQDFVSRWTMQGAGMCLHYIIEFEVSAEIGSELNSMLLSICFFLVENFEVANPHWATQGGVSKSSR